MIITEMDLKTNDSETKERNAYWLLSSNDCWLFWEDVHAIITGQEPPLPDDIFAIPPYLAEIERKKREEQERIELEARVRESVEIQKKWAAEEAERKKDRQAQLADELGIDVEVLERLKREGLSNGAIRA